jgi:HEAT repeat protein
VDVIVFLASADNEPDASVRKSAVWSLGQIRDGNALDAVVAAQHDPDAFVRDAARFATIALGGSTR